MIIPVLKFAEFSLAPFLLLLGLLLSGEAVVKSLTCDDLDLEIINYILPPAEGERTSVPPLPRLDESASVPPEVLGIPPLIASRAPWVITGLVLMGLNSYFPQLSPVSSFWFPLRATIPVLHWVASWWILSPRWEPNLDQWAACLCFPGVEPLQAEAKNDCLKDEASQTKGIITPNEETALVANQDVSPEESIGPGPDPMTATQEQNNQVVNSRFLPNKRTPGPGVISPPLNPSVQITWPHIF
ncbi:hypothetical protein DSO57_1000485 [Entomophthora muscae]|uniref:Uncharacterized protein n=1 Tax=Entomophthora muscae TaxID=34485 RepID=A0ACC2UUQ0_9FUNG|nr:hypothetical protein DSO57_1000485 [Entomophthora muscae]